MTRTLNCNCASICVYIGVIDYYPTTTGGQWVAAVAMLTGVLVIALPVSVFSDLWSEELKEVKGFESLFHDNFVDSVNDDNEETKNRRELPRQDHYQEIIMEREDLNLIVSSMHTIQNQQRHIQRILRKYYINENND